MTESRSQRRVLARCANPARWQRKLTLFVEPASMAQSDSIVVPSSSGWYRFGFGWDARTYPVAGAWYTISNYSGGGSIKQMSGGESGMPAGYTELWPNTSQTDQNGSYVGWASNYAGYSAATIAALLGATARSNNGSVVAAGNKPWAGFQQGWNQAATWDMTVRLIGYGTPPASGIVGATVTPTLHVSGKTAGLAYTGAVSGSTGKLYKTTDYGATWTLTNLPASDFGASLGGAFHFPWHDNAGELLYYWGKYASNTHYAYRTEADGTTKTVITPAAGYGPAGPKAWSTSATNRNLLALMSSDGTNVRGDFSQDGGNTWSNILAPVALASGYTGVHVADDTGILYLWGEAGVAYTGAGGLSRDDRTGNASSSPVVAIGGW